MRRRVTVLLARRHMRRYGVCAGVNRRHAKVSRRRVDTRTVSSSTDASLQRSRISLAQRERGGNARGEVAGDAEHGERGGADDREALERGEDRDGADDRVVDDGASARSSSCWPSSPSSAPLAQPTTSRIALSSRIVAHSSFGEKPSSLSLARRGRRCQIIAPIAAPIARTAAIEDQRRDLRQAREPLACRARSACRRAAVRSGRSGPSRDRARVRSCAGRRPVETPGASMHAEGARLARFPSARTKSLASIMIAPGAQPMFVRDRGEAEVGGRGAGSVKASPMRRWCSSASACERTAQPPARDPRVGEPQVAFDELARRDQRRRRRPAARAPTRDARASRAGRRGRRALHARRRASRRRSIEAPANGWVISRSNVPAGETQSVGRGVHVARGVFEAG